MKIRSIRKFMNVIRCRRMWNSTVWRSRSSHFANGCSAGRNVTHCHRHVLRCNAMFAIHQRLAIFLLVMFDWIVQMTIFLDVLWL